jgi:hypothetical protein
MDETMREAKRAYRTPTLVEYGPIADQTFQTPGCVKGCAENCHLDNFSEYTSYPAS